MNQSINLSMAFSQIAHSIKNRKVAKDVFITPTALALKCINWHDYNTTENLTWFDSCKNSGSFYNQYPVENDCNLTAKRIETCNKAGFYLKSMNIFKVYKWFGMSCYVVFSNEIDTNCVGFDRKVWRGVEIVDL